MKVMGTGSRKMIIDPIARKKYEKLRAMILDMREKDDNLVLISGMAEGLDEAIAKIGMREGIPYIAAIPHTTYGEYYWRDNSVTGKNRFDVFNELVEHATTALVLYDKLYINGIHTNFHRNTWMVRECDSAIVYQPSSSGTVDAVKKLNAAKKPWVQLGPPF